MTTWLSFRDGVRGEIDSVDKTAVFSRPFLKEDRPFILNEIEGSFAEAIEWLNQEGAPYDAFVANTLTKEGYAAAHRLYAILAQLKRLQFIQYKVVHQGNTLLSLVPTSPECTQAIPKTLPDAFYMLTEHAFWHVVEGHFVIESPLGYAKVILYDPSLLSILGSLAKPQPLSQLLPAHESMEEILLLLRESAVITAVTPQGNPLSKQGAALKQWEFHDLVFHTQSRAGRILSGVGGTYRHWGEIAPLPAVKPPMSDVIIVLPRPSIERLKQVDVPFTCVMESRRSYSVYDDKPVSAKALGEFLYRVARVQKIVPTPQTKKGHLEQVELSKRPYPSGGACYPLELYLAIRECEGIPYGYYHYCPLNHQLELVTEDENLLEQQLQNGKPGHGENLPQILITIAARFQRTAWKYEKIAYALILKECGIITQTMYLVATSMGLAPCALGLGDTELFAKLTGINYYEEGCVGELALGSRPAEVV